ncbi:MAG: bifunctional UDP-N-acetylglucosamine diphosphorylase/glucosamine-1-phosphate N-acetyltransferase GlmU [Steroidobacterales bacterium]
MPLSVVILAAGQGKRMNSGLPKVLQPLAGRPLLQHVIDTARLLGPQNIFVVYGHGGAEVQAALAAEPVDWVLQAEQLGTGHAVMQAMPMIADADHVLVLYGDVPLIGAATLRALLGAVRDASLAVLTAVVEDPTGYGRILRDTAGNVAASVEERDADSGQRQIREVNAGLIAVRAADLRGWLLDLRNDNAQREYYLTDIVALAVGGGGTVRAVRVEDPAEILGVNDRIQLAAVEGHFRRARARALMLAGVTLADPSRTDIRGEVSVGRDVYIDVGAVLVGRVELGDRVRIGPYCVIRESSLGAGTEVHANSVIDSASVGENCRIGPFARLRPGTTLDHDVHIGNFVEVKNTTIGPGTRANHLTYLGDSTVGSGVNVGAGTITCNYDGANKWPTVIGDGAFIGSGSMLVAPVVVGSNATIGAGSTVTQSTPDGKLTLTRATQTTVETWARPGKATDAERALRIDKALEKPKP